jgi:hypothetical protein
MTKSIEASVWERLPKRLANGDITIHLHIMPKRKTELSDEERAKRLRETARDVEAHATREEFEDIFKKVAQAKNLTPSAGQRGSEKS